ncbi:hypothetical protein JOC94_002398 [Bacillus thermophilus]|uniref:P68 RBP/TagC-like beta-propeller domain-containing protein n=1 Tax=Siminovitchia thermophila TaxID=1245522 RepID=A0ABS2R9X8_9BACI|nr:hypothetical protein [Siminovitchia thermophila]MBM7715411.1 hypothetical protein [Siminovitchia thermophila]ONK22584.1 hypothetical protein BLX87_15525 [Bacillus sp. VT-16-64]
MMLIIVILISTIPLTTKAKQPVPNTNMFVLSNEGLPFIQDKPLHNGTVLQSFAFDDENKHIYVVQLMAGGQQLPDENEPVSGAIRAKNGDVTLTKLDQEGNKLGHMYLKGFGHGVQIGVEVENGVTYLWTETDAVTEGNDGWGTQIARFPFENGTIRTPDSPVLEKHKLIEGADRTTVNIDKTHGLLTMRYRLDGSFRYGVFDLEQVKKGNYHPIADVPQPPVGTFQGFASYGTYLYLLEGNAYGVNGSVAPYGNTYVTAVDLNSGKAVARQLISAGNAMTFREPEGMAIRIPDPKQPHKAQLHIGFASNAAPNRLANIYYFDQLMPINSNHHRCSLLKENH